MASVKTIQKKDRLDIFDLLRGTAVITMIMAHVIAYIYNGQSVLLKSIQTYGDIVTFTTFLLVSGGVNYIAYINTEKKDWPERRSKLLKRLLNLLLVYYIFALILSIEKFLSFTALSQFFEYIFKILIFIEVPGYTEFILAFIIFGFTILLFKKFYNKLINSNIYLIFFFSIFIYIVGYLIYSANIPYPFFFWTSLIAGFENWYRFPILQYFPIFITGIYTGKFLLENSDNKIRRVFLYKSIIFLQLSFCLILLFPAITSFPYENLFNRWPPNISFLIFGLISAFAFLLLFNSETKFNQKIIHMLRYWGKIALDMYIIHIFLLEFIEISLGFKSNNIAVICVIFITIFVISTLISQLKGRILYIYQNK